MIEGLQTMGLGMGVVFAFLVLMIITMYISASVVAKLNVIFPEAKAKETTVSTNKADIAAVIAIAKAQTNG